MNNEKLKSILYRIKFMCDFEKSLLKAIKQEFNNSKINGCFFHYVKALWKKVRKLGLTKSKYLENTKLIVFALKLYPFICKKIKKNTLMKYMNMQLQLVMIINPL
jgi:hypothetical protein